MPLILIWTLPYSSLTWKLGLDTAKSLTRREMQDDFVDWRVVALRQIYNVLARKRVDRGAYLGQQIIPRLIHRLHLRLQSNAACAGVGASRATDVCVGVGAPAQRPLA